MGYPARNECANTPDRKRMEMAAGKVWAGRAVAGGCLRITCERGILWVTGEGKEDFLLGPGESYRTAEPERVVIEALGPATVEIAARGRNEARWRGFLKGLRPALSSW